MAHCDHDGGCTENAEMCFSGYGYALWYCEEHCPGFYDGSPCFQGHHPEKVPTAELKSDDQGGAVRAQTYRPSHGGYPALPPHTAYMETLADFEGFGP